MVNPDVSVILCRHTPDNVGAIIEAIPGPHPNDPTYITGIEIAFDDHNPHNDARRNVGKLQVELQRVMAGTQEELVRTHSKEFYGAFVLEAIAAERNDLKLLLVDVGRTTNGEDDLKRVTKSFANWAVTEAWDESAGDPGAYVSRRGEDIAESLTFRDGHVATQAEGILARNGQEGFSIVMGANHYGVLPLLREKGMTADAVVVDRPSPTCEIAVSNMLRQGREFDPEVLARMGLAEWIAPEYISSSAMFNILRKRNPTEFAVRKSAEIFYQRPDTPYVMLPAFQ